MIVIVPKMILDEILEHASSNPEKEVIGVLLGKSMDRLIEITDIVSYPEASYPERAMLPGNFLYSRIGDEIRERNYSVNVKGYYHSHPPDVFPLKFSHVDFRQYEDLQSIFARKQPFLAIIVDPVSRNYSFLTLDVDRREIRLEPFSYENLLWVDYAVKRFSDGFSPYHIDPRTGEGTIDKQFQSLLHNLSQKYEQKEIVRVMLHNAEEYKKELEEHGDSIEGVQNLLELFREAKMLYFSENFIEVDKSLEQFIKEYVENLSGRIEEVKEKTVEAITWSSRLVLKINQKIHHLIEAIEREFPHDSTKIAAVMLDIRREIDDLGEPFCRIQIDKAMKLTIPPTEGISEEHLEYVEKLIDERIIEHLGEETLERMEHYLEPGEQEKIGQVDIINHLLDSYFKHYYAGTRQQLTDEINEALIFYYIRKGYSIKGLFFENLALVLDNLREIFGDDIQEVLPDIETFLKEKIRRDIGIENLNKLLGHLRNKRF